MALNCHGGWSTSGFDFAKKKKKKAEIKGTKTHMCCNSEEIVGDKQIQITILPCLKVSPDSISF